MPRSNRLSYLAILPKRGAKIPDSAAMLQPCLRAPVFPLSNGRRPSLNIESKVHDISILNGIDRIFQTGADATCQVVAAVDIAGLV